MGARSTDSPQHSVVSVSRRLRSDQNNAPVLARAARRLRAEPTSTFVIIVLPSGVRESAYRNYNFKFPVLKLHTTMNSDNKNTPKNQNNSQYSSYNPWNLLFTSSRTRTESENSGSSTSSQNYQTGPQCGALQRQTSKSNEEYLWMMWRS